MTASGMQEVQTCDKDRPWVTWDSRKGMATCAICGDIAIVDPPKRILRRAVQWLFALVWAGSLRRVKMFADQHEPCGESCTCECPDCAEE